MPYPPHAGSPESGSPFRSIGDVDVSDTRRAHHVDEQDRTAPATSPGRQALGRRGPGTGTAGEGGRGAVDDGGTRRHTICPRSDIDGLRGEIEIAEHGVVALMRHSGMVRATTRRRWAARPSNGNRNSASPTTLARCSSESARDRGGSGRTYGVCENCGNAIGKLRPGGLVPRYACHARAKRASLIDATTARAVRRRAGLVWAVSVGAVLGGSGRKRALRTLEPGVERPPSSVTRHFAATDPQPRAAFLHARGKRPIS